MMKLLFVEKKYSYSLFFGQLALEKLLKAIYIKKIDSSPPYIHNLNSLAKKSKIKIHETYNKELEEITQFNINARYDDYKDAFYKKATKEYATKWIKIINKIKLCLKKKYK